MGPAGTPPDACAPCGQATVHLDASTPSRGASRGAVGWGVPPSTPSTLCILCNHPDRAALDAALDQGVSLSEIARRAGTSRTSVRRHQAHRDAKPGGPPAEADALHPEAEPASAPLPEPAPAPPAAPRPSSPRLAPPLLPSPAPAPPPGEIGVAGGDANQPTPGGKAIAFPGGRARPGPSRRSDIYEQVTRDQIMTDVVAALRAIDA